MGSKKKKQTKPRAKAKSTTARKTKTKVTAPKKNGGPVSQVWAIAASMPGAARKDVLAACAKKGINPFTARTQYQRWRTARKGTA